MKLKNKYKILLSLFIILAAFIYIFKGIDNYKRDSYNKEMIRITLSQLLTCPNGEMIKIYNNMITSLTNSKKKIAADSDVLMLNNDEIDKELIKIYSSYISKEYLKKFMEQFKTKYYIYSTTAGYQTSVIHIEITQSKSIPMNYSFVVSLNYGLEGKEMKNIELNGAAQISKDSEKISYIKIIDKDLITELKRYSIK